MDEPGETLGGFEGWRTSVYGSTAVQRRGARFLPALAHTDLLIEGSDLAEFIAECTSLLNDVDALARETQVGVGTLRHRIENFARAAKKAQTIAGLLRIS